MASNEPDAQQASDDLEVTELRPHSARDSDVLDGVRAGVRRWRRLALALSLVLTVALLLSRLPLARDALGRLVRAPTALASPTAAVSPLALPSPSAPLGTPTPPPTPTVVLDATGHPSIPTLDPAPATCGQPAPPLTQAGPPQDGGAIGQVPVRIAGFAGPYATLRLGPAASANAYGWTAPYSRYGWPAPIILVVSSFNGPPLVCPPGGGVAGARPAATIKYCCPCRYSIFSPLVERRNPLMPSRILSVLRVFRSNI